jgi:hypothetical protein
VVEGEATAPAVLARAARHGIEMPICAAVDAILHQARISTRRSAACWRAVCGAKGSEMAHWLIKSEPSAYAWDQLVKDKRTSWTGVRNPQASLNLKAMKPGDLCFFYHSNEGKEIVGIAKVLKAAYPDPTDKAGKAVTVDVAPVEPVKQAVTLPPSRPIPGSRTSAWCASRDFPWFP